MDNKTPKNTGSDLDALKETIRCMKDENCDNLSILDVVSNNHLNNVNINNNCEQTTNNPEEDEFLGPEARGRCYTWPVVSTQHQILSFGIPPSCTDDSDNFLSISKNGSCTSLAYSQNHSLVPQQIAPYDQPSKFLTLISNSSANTITGNLTSPTTYSNSQPDLCSGGLSNYAYLRSLCSSSPAFPSNDSIPSPCQQLRILQPVQHSLYFGSEASCSFMSPTSSGNINSDSSSQNVNTSTMDSTNFDFNTTAISPQNGFSVVANVYTSNDSNLNSASGANIKIRKRGRKPDSLLPLTSSLSISDSSSCNNGLINSSFSSTSASAPQKKPNAWGSDSYAELIEKAILSSPGGRLKLNEIYDWFIDNIPYFCKRSSQDGAVGWKNSIRHNLSLHSRFMRIQNEGAGKSSWWVINPEAKPGRNPRRRAATLEAATKAVIDKKRRGVKKRLEMGLSAGVTLHSSSGINSQPILPDGIYGSFGPEDDVTQLGASCSNFDSFRSRTQSILSVPGTSSRLSPTQQEPPGFEDFDFPPYRDSALNRISNANVNNGSVSELLDRTDQMRIDGEFRPLQTASSNCVKIESTQPQQAQQPNAFLSQQQSNQLQQSQQEIKPENMDISVKPESLTSVAQPPSYHELNVVRAPSQLHQNPLLRAQLQQAQALAASNQHQTKIANATPGQNFQNPLHWQGSTGQGLQSNGTSFSPHQISQQSNYMMNSCGISTQSYNGNVGNNFSVSNVGGANLATAGGGLVALPMDLQNLSMSNSLIGNLDMEAVLMHDWELQTNDQSNLDLP